MSESDRQHDTPKADGDLPVEDLRPTSVDARAADQVKGGAPLTQSTDAPPANLMHELVHGSRSTSP
jgi:hypothetical protein